MVTRHSLPWILFIAVKAQAQFSGTFTTIDVPAAVATYPMAINSAGTICGSYTLASVGAYHGFVRSPQGVITTFDVPGSLTTAALGINSAGIIVGYWSPDIYADVRHAFTRDPSGVFHTFDVPGHSINSASGINDAGQMVLNALEQPGPNAAVFLGSDGTYTNIMVPGASNIYVQGLNNSGFVVGSAYGSDSSEEAFVTNPLQAGSTTTFIFPNSTTNTVANGINDQNEIVGYYTLGFRGGQSSHGFIRDHAGTFTALDVPGSRATLAFGVNNNGMIVGYYDDINGLQRGFLAVPGSTFRRFHLPTPPPRRR